MKKRMNIVMVALLTILASCSTNYQMSAILLGGVSLNGGKGSMGTRRFCFLGRRQ